MTTRYVDHVMGLPVSLALRGRHTDDDAARGAWAEAMAALRDPSGVVKGWAVQRAVRPLLRLPGTDVCVSAGGDLVCQVAGPGSPDWRIGVEDPRDPSRVLAVIPVRTGAVATSGLTHRGGHVVDARTGRTPTAVASVTVVHDDLTWADIDATAALALDADAVAWLRTRPVRSAVVVHTDGRREVVVPNASDGAQMRAG